MKKVLISVMMLALVLLWTAAVSAFVRYEDKHPKKQSDVTLTGYTDYAPFGQVEFPGEAIIGKFKTFMQPMLDTLAQENKIRYRQNFDKQNYPAQIQQVRRGEIDVALGVYHETETFRGLELVYPAVLINPVTVFMLPQRIDEVKSTDDLKKLKGVRTSKETYSDFVEQQLAAYNIETVDNSYDLFERLFTRKADYILISQFYGLIEASKLGLRNQISIAKQTLWQIPMFIGISKLSRHRKLLAQKFTRYLENPQNRELLKQNLIKFVEQAEIDSQGVVPPTFGMELPADKPLDVSGESVSIKEKQD